MSRVMVRATNWLGDAVMSLPAVRAIRGVFPHAHLAVVAKPWVADLYARERAIDRVIPVPAMKGLRARRASAAKRVRRGIDCVDGRHSGAHRVQAGWTRMAAHARDSRARAGRYSAP